MNPTTPAVKPTSQWRIVLWWTLGLMAGSALALGLVVVNLVTLNRDTATLRKAMFAASGVSAKTEAQVDIGPAWMQAARLTLAFIPHVPAEARLALKAARRACVGVYKIQPGAKGRGGASLMARADAEMAGRGWTRSVGVMQKAQTVLVYTPTQPGDGELLRICVAVCEGDHIVVVSAEVAAAPLQQLVERTGGFKGARLALR